MAGLPAGRLAAIVVASRERRSQKGNKFAFVQFSDASGQFETIVFSDTLAAAAIADGGDAGLSRSKPIAAMGIR